MGDVPADAANTKGSNLADLSKAARHGSYAHFPGSGPPGTYCERCSLFSPAEKRRGWGLCIKHKQLMGAKGNQIRAATPSCKYFEQ